MVVRWGAALACALASAVIAVPVPDLHEACPCSTEGAVLLQLDQGSGDDVPSNSIIQPGAMDANATGLLDTNGTLNLLNAQAVNTEEDSICVCKRGKKPKSPVRCTRGDLLNGDCNERDKMRKNGYEVAPPGKLTSLYPDEAIPKKSVPKAGKGKVFHDQFIEATAVKNEPVEDKEYVGYAKVGHLQKPTHVRLSSEELRPVEQQQAPRTSLPAPAVPGTPTVSLGTEEAKFGAESTQSPVAPAVEPAAPVTPPLSSGEAVEAVVDTSSELADAPPVQAPAPAVEAPAPAAETPAQPAADAPTAVAAEYHEPFEANPAAGATNAPDEPTDAATVAGRQPLERIGSETEPQPAHKGGPGLPPPPPVQETDDPAPSSAPVTITPTTHVDGAMMAKLLQQQLAEQAEVTALLKKQLEQMEKKMEAMQTEKAQEGVEVQDTPSM